MTYLANSFSLQMLADLPAVPVIEQAAAEEIPADTVSVIGHADTAMVVGKLLGREVPMNRQSIVLEKDDILYVAQILGGRLPEGATTLPEGFELKFLKVTVRYADSLCVSAKGKVCPSMINCGNCSYNC